MHQRAKKLQMLVISHLFMVGQQAFDQSFWHNSGKISALASVDFSAAGLNRDAIVKHV
ncbi:MAG: hypothetical protein AB2694_18005 [Candidatus Thiodiazotropha sp.]